MRKNLQYSLQVFMTCHFMVKPLLVSSGYGLLALVKGKGKGFCVHVIQAYQESEVVGYSPTHS